MHLKINSKWELRHEKISNYIPHKINRMVNPDSQKSKKYAQSYRKLETKTITAPQTGAFFHNDWMKSLFSMAVLNKHKMCMVLYDMLGSKYDNEISDFRTCFFTAGILYDRLVLIKELDCIWVQLR